MASWTSTLKKCGKNLFNVELKWNDGQGSSVKKFNNGIPIFVHSKEFYDDTLFFLLVAGKERVVPHSVFLDLGPTQGKIKLFNASTQYVELFVKHWSAAGIKGLTTGDNCGIKEQKPDKNTIKNVRLYFEEVSRSLDLNIIKTTISETKELNAKYLAEVESSKTPIKKKKTHTKPEIKIPKLRSGICREKKSSSAQKVTTKNNNIVPIASYIKSLSVKGVFMHALKATIVTREGGGYELKVLEDNADTNKQPFTVTTLPFRTKKSVSKALSLVSEIGNDAFEISPFSLYLCHTVVKENAEATRRFHKLVSGSSELIELLIEDWSGTPLGYALYKTINKNLGKSTYGKERENIINQYFEMNKKQGSEFNISQALA